MHRPFILLGVIDLSGEHLVPVHITSCDYLERPAALVDSEHKLPLLVAMHVREHPPGLRERVADDRAESSAIEAGEADEPSRGSDKPEVPGREEAEGELVAGVQGDAEHAAVRRRVGAAAPGEGEEAGPVGGHRGVRGEEGRVVENGLPSAGDGAEAEEEEGRHAGEHLEEEVVGEPRPDAGVHRDVRVVVEQRARGAGACAAARGGAGGGLALGERGRRGGVLVEPPRLGAADRLGRPRRARGPRGARGRRRVHGGRHGREIGGPDSRGNLEIWRGF